MFLFFDEEHTGIHTARIFARGRIVVKVGEKEFAAHQNVAARRKGKIIFVIFLSARGHFVNVSGIEPLERDAGRRCAFPRQ